MPTSFLDLPREVRNMIYSEYFTSPTSHFLIKLHKSPPKSGQAPFRGIRLQPCLPLSSTPLSGSLPCQAPTVLERTCRQVHAETHGLLWEYNTICFSSQVDVFAVFTHIGQRASRLIQRAHLHIVLCASLRPREVGRAVCMLASRSRRGSLREAGLVIHANAEDIYALCLLVPDSSVAMIRVKFESLQLAIYGADLGWPEGTARCLYLKWDGLDACHPMMLEDVVMGLHLSWGGKLICRGVLVWNDHEIVGKIPVGASETDSKGDVIPH